MLKIVSIQYKMMGPWVTLQGDSYDTPAKLVDKIFKDLSCSDGKITLSDFKSGAMKDPTLVQGLGLL